MSSLAKSKSIENINKISNENKKEISNENKKEISEIIQENVLYNIENPIGGLSPDIETHTYEIGNLSKFSSIIEHCVIENAYNDNLLCDVSKVDYTENNLGDTLLQPLEGLPFFYDDMLVYGYATKEQVTKGSKAKLVDHYASNVLSRINSFFDFRKENGVDEHGNKIYKKVCTSTITHTVLVYKTDTDRKDTSVIRDTVARIESNNKCAGRRNWEKTNPGKEVYAYFIVKVSTSEVAKEEIDKKLPVIESQLILAGMGLYCIDYTQDFSGTMKHSKIVEYLKNKYNMEYKPTVMECIKDTGEAILENEKSAGNNVCTWVETDEDVITRYKFYNKIVSNFESGKVGDIMGGHLADYVECSDPHLRKTFHHKDVQERGVTRIEVSHYGSIKKGVIVGSKLLEKAYNKLADPSLFCIQPAKMQYYNLVKKIDRCFVVSEKTSGTVCVAWYANTLTGKIGGVRKTLAKKSKAEKEKEERLVNELEKYKRRLEKCKSQDETNNINNQISICTDALQKIKADDDKRWIRTIQSAITDFGFRNCPIFYTNITMQNKKIDCSELRSFYKEPDAYTILAPCKHPNAVKKRVTIREDGTKFETPPAEINDYLVETSVVKWEWRTQNTKSTHGRGTEKLHQSYYELQTNKSIICFDKRKREEMIEIADNAEHQATWLQQMEDKNKAAYEQREKDRKEMILKYQEQIAKNVANKKLEHVRKSNVLTFINKHKQKISEQKEKEWYVIGWKMTPNNKTVLLENIHNKNIIIPIWCTSHLERICNNLSEVSIKTKDEYKKEISYISAIGEQLQIKIGDKKEFTSGCRTISYNPIIIISQPTKIPVIEDITLKEILSEQSIPMLEKVISPIKRVHWTNAVNIPPGEYKCNKYTKITYRNVLSTGVFLDVLDKKTNQIEEKIVHGYFLEKEIERIEKTYGELDEVVYQPIVFHFGIAKTTPTKKKCRSVVTYHELKKPITFEPIVKHKTISTDNSTVNEECNEESNGESNGDNKEECDEKSKEECDEESNE